MQSSVFDKIQNPKTGRWVNLNGNTGRSILNKYNILSGGSERRSSRVAKANYLKEFREKILSILSSDRGDKDDAIQKAKENVVRKLEMIGETSDVINTADLIADLIANFEAERERGSGREKGRGRGRGSGRGRGRGRSRGRGRGRPRAAATSERKDQLELALDKSRIMLAQTEAKLKAAEAQLEANTSGWGGKMACLFESVKQELEECNRELAETKAQLEANTSGRGGRRAGLTDDEQNVETMQEKRDTLRSSQPRGRDHWGCNRCGKFDCIKRKHEYCDV